MENIPCGNFLFHYSYNHNMVYSNVNSVCACVSCAHLCVYGFRISFYFFIFIDFDIWIFHSNSNRMIENVQNIFGHAICSSSAFAVAVAFDASISLPLCLCPFTLFLNLFRAHLIPFLDEIRERKSLSVLPLLKHASHFTAPTSHSGPRR